MTRREAFLNLKSSLLAVAEDEHNHILDRVDAYLELSQLHQRDDHDRAVYVREARELIRKEQKG